MVMLNHNLHIFLNVAEKGSITETANTLYISQPAVSKAIKNLEDELNLKLFHRDKRKGLILTDEGQKIFLLARQMAELENRIYQTAFRSNNFVGGKVKIASIPILSSVILSEVFYNFKIKYPQVALELVEGNSMEIRKAVEEYQVDFAITASPFGNLDYEILIHDKMIGVSKEPIVDEKIIDLNLQPEKFIFCRASYETTLEILRAHNVNITKSFIVEQPETVIKFVENKNGIGILSELVANNIPNNLFRYPIVPNVQIDIGLIANSLSDLTFAANELKEMIIEFVKNKK